MLEPKKYVAKIIQRGKYPGALLESSFKFSSTEIVLISATSLQHFAHNLKNSLSSTVIIF